MEKVKTDEGRLVAWCNCDKVNLTWIYKGYKICSKCHGQVKDEVVEDE